MTKYFISHSVKDVEYSNKFNDFLRLAFSINHTEIFCSSYAGCKVKIGEDFVKYIQKELIASDIVFALISPNYIESTFCTAELGASWVLGKRVIPILISKNMQFSDLSALYEHVNAIRINDEEGLSSIADIIKEYAPDLNIANMNKKISEFIEIIEVLQQNPIEQTTIDYSKYKEKEEEIKRLNKNIDHLKSELNKKDADIRNIKALKDASAVKEYEEEQNQDYIDKFEVECKKFAKLMNEYSRVVRYIAYKYACGECANYKYMREYYTDSDISNAIDMKLIEDTESGYRLSSGIKSKKIRNAIEDLENFILRLQEEVHNYVEDEYELEIDISDVEFWEKCLNIIF